MGIESLLSFLIVIPEVITDADGRNGGDLVFGVFPPSNRGRKIYLWQVASRKLVVFGIYFGSTCPRTFLEDSCHEQPARLSELEVPAMAPHSSALAWTIPWTEEPGGLQSMGSRRGGRD